MTTFSVETKLACAQRELAMRRRVYPRWVDAKRMSREKADQEIALMQAIVDDYAGAVSIAESTR